MKKPTSTWRKMLGAGLVTLLFLAHPAWSHGDHGHSAPVSKQEVKLRSGAVLQQLLRQNSLAPTWENSPIAATDIQETAYGDMWIVKYSNADEKDSAKRDLYIFIDLFGNVVSANHLGTLEAE